MTDQYESIVTQLVESSICKSEFEEYQTCLDSSNSKKKQLKCSELYKKYQYCITEREEERLNQSHTFQNFKTKWGHYPWESPKDSE